jgi:hypothetical protein
MTLESQMINSIAYFMILFDHKVIVPRTIESVFSFIDSLIFSEVKWQYVHLRDLCSVLG